MIDFFARLWAMIIKEALQLRRDRLTFAMMFIVPIVQLVLFGFAINADPKGLPTAVLVSEHSQLSRSLVAAIANTGYFTVTKEAATEAEAAYALFLSLQARVPAAELDAFSRAEMRKWAKVIREGNIKPD